MGMSRVTYNDYVFPDRSNFHITESFIYDPSDRTVIATRFLLRLQTIIVNEGITGPLSTQHYAKDYVHYARQRISKAGARLIIEHDGFGPTFDINSSSMRDVAWGPKPRVIDWNPVGHTNAVEITWEVEWQMPICDSSSPPSNTGLSSFSYGVSYEIDQRGYTTRTISGNIQIAMTRPQGGGRNLIDSVDNYRNRVNFQKPTNFQRRVSWQVSDDKRSANFSIVDSEIDSPNAWAPGVVSIMASHRASWARTNVNRIMNTISATIEMSPDAHKAQSWMIFRAIVEKRVAFAAGNGDTSSIFFEQIEVIEDIYANRASFQLTYRVLGGGEEMGSTAIMMQGLFQPVSDNQWIQWDDSVKQLQPFRGLNTDRGNAGLVHEWQTEKLVDLCSQSPPGTLTPPQPAISPRVPTPVLCNKKPVPSRSWISIEATLTYYEIDGTHTAAELKANDLRHADYNFAHPDENFPESDGSVKRFTEDQAGTQEFVWTGTAERVGYPVPKPGRMKINNVYYVPVGNGVFSQSYLGLYFCQPKYAAAWKQRYRLASPIKVKSEDSNGGVE